MTESSTPADLPLVQFAADGTVGYCYPETGTCALPDASEIGDGLVEYRPTH